jgi:integrase
MFSLAIYSRVQGCDVVRLRVEDIAPHGHAVDRATVRQKKTGQPVKFEMTEQTREAGDDYIAAANKKPGEFLFDGRRGHSLGLPRYRGSGPLKARRALTWASIGNELYSISRLLRQAVASSRILDPHV